MLFTSYTASILKLCHSRIPAMRNNATDNKTAKKVWKIVRWILGVWIMLGAIGGLSAGELWQAAIAFTIGLVLLPIKYLTRSEQQDKRDEKTKREIK